MNTTDQPSGWRRWWLGVRPPTLGLSLVPVLLGTALGVRLGGSFDPGSFLVAAFCVLCIQAGTNLFNDAGDGARGADGPERLGPQRLVGSGLATVAEVRRAACLCFGLALLGGLVLAWQHGAVIIVIGLASLLAGWLYSAGSRPLSHTPWGESCVLLFFGLVAVAGSCFLQTGRFSALALAFGVVPGLYAAAVLLEVGIANVIVTLGSRGALWMTRTEDRLIPGVAVEARDTTGAGDAFIGCFSHFLVSTGDTATSLEMANRYSADSVTKRGTQSSYASKEEFEAILSD